MRRSLPIDRPDDSVHDDLTDYTRRTHYEPPTTVLDHHSNYFTLSNTFRIAHLCRLVDIHMMDRFSRHVIQHNDVMNPQPFFTFSRSRIWLVAIHPTAITIDHSRCLATLLGVLVLIFFLFINRKLSRPLQRNSSLFGIMFLPLSPKLLVSSFGLWVLLLVRIVKYVLTRISSCIGVGGT